MDLLAATCNCYEDAEYSKLSYHETKPPPQTLQQNISAGS